MDRRLFLALSCFFLASCNRTPVALRNTDLTGATFGRGLELSDHNGQLRSLADFGGRVIVVFFGYTSCPDICPTTLARFVEVMKALGPEAQKVQVLFVTLDPERDSAERPKDFVPWFYPSFLGLRGDAGQIKAVTEEFRVFSARKDVGSDLGYKPYVAGQYIYSNQVIARDVPGKGIAGEVDLIAEKGLLKLHPFVPDNLRTITDANRLEAGKLLARIACANCHSLEPGAPLRSLPDKFHGATDEDLIAAFLRGPLKHGAVPYMPRIDLPEEEIRAIAGYIAAINAGKDTAVAGHAASPVAVADTSKQKE